MVMGNGQRYYVINQQLRNPGRKRSRLLSFRSKTAGCLVVPNHRYPPLIRVHIPNRNPRLLLRNCHLQRNNLVSPQTSRSGTRPGPLRARSKSRRLLHRCCILPGTIRCKHCSQLHLRRIRSHCPPPSLHQHPSRLLLLRSPRVANSTMATPLIRQQIYILPLSLLPFPLLHRRCNDDRLLPRPSWSSPRP